MLMFTFIPGSKLSRINIASPIMLLIIRPVSEPAIVIPTQIMRSNMSRLSNGPVRFAIFPSPLERNPEQIEQYYKGYSRNSADCHNQYAPDVYVNVNERQ